MLDMQIIKVGDNEDIVNYRIIFNKNEEYEIINRRDIVAIEHLNHNPYAILNFLKKRGYTPMSVNKVEDEELKEWASEILTLLLRSNK